MAKEFLGKGWKFPVNVDTGGNIRMSEHEDNIKEAILIILSTAKGERVMRPDFGCGIHDLVFAQINSAVFSLIRSSVTEALKKWEPRIDVIKVDISSEKADEGKLLVNIEYEIRSTNNRYNMVYPFYIRES